MKNLTATLCLTIAVLLGSTSMLVVPSTAEAGFLSAIFKAIFGESDKIAKTTSEATANLKGGGSKTTDGAVGKIEGEGYTYTALYGSRTLREQFRTKNKCPSNRWAISVFQNTNIYSEPKISSKIIGTLDKDEKVCVVKEEGDWAKTFYGWVENQQIKKL